MFSLKEYREPQERLADFLPWAAIIAPGVVLNKDGSFQKTFAFRGHDLSSATRDFFAVCVAKINNVLKRLGSGWTYFVEARRFAATSYPQSAFPDPLSLLIDQERAADFDCKGAHFESEYFFTLLFMPPEDSRGKMEARMIEGREQAGYDAEGYLESFVTECGYIADLFKDTFALFRDLTDDETLTYLHATISTRRHPLKAPETPVYLDAILPDMPLVGGLEPMLGEHHLRVVSINGFPAASIPAILDGLNHLAFSYRWCTRYILLDKIDALNACVRLKKRWFSKRKGIVTLLKEVITSEPSQLEDSEALKKAGDADSAALSVSEDLVTYGYFTGTVVVWDRDLSGVEKKLNDAVSVINRNGFAAKVEKVNAVEAWLGSLPGQVYANVRRPLISTLNLAHIMPVSAVWAGPSENAHLKAPPLLYTRTTGSTPFRLSHHIGDVGHCFIGGPTGTGKSTLLNLMSVQSLRYPGAQVYRFDKGGSALVMTKAVAGKFYNLRGEGENLAFQPLAQIDSEHYRRWAAGWVEELFVQEGLTPGPKARKETWDALNSLSTHPAAQRTITGLMAEIQSLELRQALEAYSLNGPYGDLLDANRDSFEDSRWQCFEMEHLLHTPKVVPVILSYLFHRLEQSFNGAYTTIWLDESWVFLDNPIFSEKLKEWLKTTRRKNVAVIFATQSLSDVANSNITAVIKESCFSRIFLANPKAFEKDVFDLYRGFGLNESQIHIIGHARGKREYYLQSDAGNRLFDLGFGPVALCFCGATSEKDQALARALLKDEGEGDFPYRFLTAKGLEEAASRYQALSKRKEP